MLEEPKPNAWETVGWSWQCSCGEGSMSAVLYDYGVAFAPAAVPLESRRSGLTTQANEGATK